MKVYVVEMGCYSNRGVVGVYATLKGAKAAMPGKKWERQANTWTNELDWDSFVEIVEHEVGP